MTHGWHSESYDEMDFLGALSGSKRPYFACSTLPYIFYVSIVGKAWTMTKVVTSTAALLIPNATPLRGDS
jgi:hypothetical protein